jgi:N-acetylglutamate synthase-like GNAT family acetyltransferase
MTQVQIKAATNPQERDALDQLLWQVLWQPLNLPRDARKSFGLDRESVELIAVLDADIVGGLVANWLSTTEMEIRHIAVLPTCQGQSVGRQLVEKLIELVKPQQCSAIQAIARNTSQAFFEKLGFVAEPEILEHPDFAKHGITFRVMRYALA